ncbi:cutinase family protein [Mycobacterium kansasii]|uniref:Cutinase family protein n=1 Tax=Mycobacterium kansasii TaxID=1768 RepID=A0A1V3XAS0_MYCKA|nr:cutinase family protein [Mycobacterium kansasii]
MNPAAQLPAASAEPCPDVEVLFARGTGEPPGIGSIGASFVEALRPQIGSRSLEVYAINYAASTDFSSSDFPLTVIDGVRDASAHIESMAANCPGTREILGGYSQGAAVAGYVTSAAVPPGVPRPRCPRRCRPRSPITLPRLLFSEHRRINSWLGTVLRRSPSGRCIGPRPSSCAPTATPFAAAATIRWRTSHMR